MPTSNGIPARANSKKRKRPDPAWSAASDTTTLTGLPVSASIEPAWAAKASGISNCDVGFCNRSAITTTTGTSAATDALGVMNAVSSAHTSMTDVTIRRESDPARLINC